MKRHNKILIAIALVAFTLADYATAKDCTVSKVFTIKQSQKFSGTLKDPAQGSIAGMTLDLINKGKQIKSLVTDSNGAFDFGELSPGQYAIRIRQGQDKSPFCAPPVKCAETGCEVHAISQFREKPIVVM